MQKDGTVTRNRGLTSAARSGTGVYKLTWAEAVGHCYPLASLAEGAGSAVIKETAERSVTLATFDATGNAADAAFYVAVLC